MMTEPRPRIPIASPHHNSTLNPEQPILRLVGRWLIAVAGSFLPLWLIGPKLNSKAGEG
jgi:hypothetical protein